MVQPVCRAECSCDHNMSCFQADRCSSCSYHRLTAFLFGGTTRAPTRTPVSKLTFRCELRAFVGLGQKTGGSFERVGYLRYRLRRCNPECNVGLDPMPLVAQRNSTHVRA
jgi:hypothetical protein